MSASAPYREWIGGDEWEEVPNSPDQNADGPPNGLEIEVLRGQLLAGTAILEIPKPAPLVEGVLDLDSVAIGYGRPGSGKSLWALDVAASVASGVDWHGRAVTQGPVLYLAGEGLAGLGIRVAAWREYHRGDIGDLIWLPRAVNLLEARWVAALVDLVAEIHPAMTVVDTVARSMAGGDENSAKDVGRLIDAADQIRRAAGSCVLLVHHQGKDETRGMRGSSALEAGCDTAWEITRTDTQVTLTNPRQKNHAADADPIVLEMVNIAESVVLVPNTRRVADDLHANIRTTLAALAAIDTGAGTSPSTWLKSGDANERSFYRHVKRLLDLRCIENTGTESRPRYRLTPEGHDSLQ